MHYKPHKSHQRIHRALRLRANCPTPGHHKHARTHTPLLPPDTPPCPTPSTYCTRLQTRSQEFRHERDLNLGALVGLISSNSHPTGQGSVQSLLLPLEHGLFELLSAFHFADGPIKPRVEALSDAVVQEEAGSIALHLLFSRIAVDRCKCLLSNSIVYFNSNKTKHLANMKVNIMNCIPCATYSTRFDYSCIIP